MFGRKNRGGDTPPDIGKEEQEAYKDNVVDAINNNPDFDGNEANNSSAQNADNFNAGGKGGGQAPDEEQVQYQQAPAGGVSSFEIEKINLKLDMLNSFVTAFNERFARINEQIGELRAMAATTEKNLSISNLDAQKAVDIVKEVDPEKLRLDYQKMDFKVGALVQRTEAYRQYIDSIMEELKELKRRANLFEGADAVLKLNDDVKKDLLQIQKINSKVRMNADKSEQIFIEMSKGVRENQKVNEMVENLDTSYAGLKKEIERLTLDYKKILNTDDFGSFKKDIANKMMILENSYSDIDKLKEKTDQISKDIGELYSEERKNEEDITTMGFSSGNNNIRAVGDYEQKLFSILEVVEKMTSEINNLKDKLGVKESEETPAAPGQEAITPEQVQQKEEAERLRQENEKKMNEMLAAGKKMISGGDLTTAWKIYKDIYSVYNPADDINKQMYYKIINFYDTLADFLSRPAAVPVRMTTATAPAIGAVRGPPVQRFPAFETGQKQFKQLNNY